MTTFAHDAAERMFGDAYTLERREFSDGDTRTIIVHNVGVTSTCYLQVRIWVERGEVWIEYYEGDVRRCKTTMDYDTFDADRDPWEYIW